MDEAPKKEGLDVKRARAAEAKELLENKAFQYATLKLRQQWFQELLNNGGGDLTGARLCARISALEAVATELALLIKNYQMDARNG
jgi:hypothetical protein